MNEKLRILVVEDNEKFAQNMKDVLELKGYEVLTATDGFKALEFVKKNGFHLVLMDIKMPVMNGVETYLAIRDIRSDVVVIIITGYLKEMGDVVADAVQKCVYTCLEKPINIDRLILLLEQIEVQKAKGELKKPA